MWRQRKQSREPPRHAYDLYAGGRRVGRLEWRQRSRREAGWYLVRARRPAQRLEVDPSIAQLARDERSAQHEWELSAELAAILSTALALDAAGAMIDPDYLAHRGQLRRLGGARRFQMQVAGLEADVLAHTVPELQLDAVADVAVLGGVVPEDAVEAAIHRVQLLGGRVVGIFPAPRPGTGDPPSPS